MNEEADEIEYIDPLKVGSGFVEFENGRKRRAYLDSIFRMPFWMRHVFSCASGQIPSNGLFQPRETDGELAKVEVFTKGRIRKYINLMFKAYEKRLSYLKNRASEYPGDVLFGTAAAVYLDGSASVFADKSLYPKMEKLLQDGKDVGIYIMILATTKDKRRIGGELIKAAHLNVLLDYREDQPAEAPDSGK
jgi:hypothetical protein